MKRIGFIITLLLVSLFDLTSYGQDNTRQIYCEVVAYQLIAGGKTRISVDFGDRHSFWTGTKTQITGDGGSVAKFNSVIDALNYMGSLGWELQTCMLLGSNGSYTYHYIMKMDVPGTYEILERKESEIIEDTPHNDEDESNYR